MTHNSIAPDSTVSSRSAMQPKVNMADMQGMIQSIEEYLRSCYGVVRASLTCVIRKTILVQTYSDYPKYVTSDDKIIIKMLDYYICSQ